MGIDVVPSLHIATDTARFQYLAVHLFFFIAYGGEFGYFEGTDLKRQAELPS